MADPSTEALVLDVSALERIVSVPPAEARNDRIINPRPRRVFEREDLHEVAMRFDHGASPVAAEGGDEGWGEDGGTLWTCCYIASPGFINGPACYL